MTDVSFRVEAITEVVPCGVDCPPFGGCGREHRFDTGLRDYYVNGERVVEETFHKAVAALRFAQLWEFGRDDRR